MFRRNLRGGSPPCRVLYEFKKKSFPDIKKHFFKKIKKIDLLKAHKKVPPMKKGPKKNFPSQSFLRKSFGVGKGRWGGNPWGGVENAPL